MLSGCASFRSEPPQYFTPEQISQTAAFYALPQAYVDYQALDAERRKNYRNQFIWAHMGALDDRYYDFRGDLRTERKGVDLGFDAILLILAGAGSLAASAASELAVVTTGVVGLRGAVNRDVFYDRALAIVISSMDGERFRLATAMSEKMERDDASYPLVAAIMDLRAYEAAGTVDNAILRIERETAADTAAAEEAFAREVRYACTASAELIDATASLGQLNRKLMRAAAGQADNAATPERLALQQLAALYGVPTEVPNEEMSVGIVSAFNAGFCTVDQVESFKRRVRAAFPGETL
jgi:hypothetical protein